MTKKKSKKKTTTKSTSKKTTKSAPKKNARVSGQRVPVNLLVDYRSNGNYLFDFCKDLGSGGIFIETDSPLSSGEEIELTFTIPDSKETFDTKGVVMWSQAKVKGRPELTPGMGIQFNHFSQTDRDKLEAFVKRYNPKFKDHEFKEAKTSKVSA